MIDADLYASASSGTKLSEFQRGYMNGLYDYEETIKNITQHMRIGFRKVLILSIRKYIL